MENMENPAPAAENVADRTAPTDAVNPDESADKAVAETTGTVVASEKAASPSLTEEQRGDYAPDWREALPESVRKKADGFDSIEALLDAAERGAAYKPALRAEDLEYAPEGVEMDKAAAAEFRELGVKIGLTPAQAKALVDFEAGAVAERARRNAEEGVAFLKQKWGNEYEDNVAHAKRALLALDNKTEGRLSQLFGKDGLGTVPSLLEAFALIGKDMAEDAAAGAKAAGSAVREDALGMFARMFH